MPPETQGIRRVRDIGTGLSTLERGNGRCVSHARNFPGRSVAQVLGPKYWTPKVLSQTQLSEGQDSQPNPFGISVTAIDSWVSRSLSNHRGPALSLGRLESQGVLARVARGIWCVPSDPRFSRFLLVSYLSGLHRAYVSFFSALHLHGMIEQIPQIVYAATTAHSHVETTPLGTYSFHQVDPRFFAGFDWYRDSESFLIASREKALVDCLYLSTRKGRRFGRFPELEFDRQFSIMRARRWTRLIPDGRIRRIVSEKLEAVWHRRLFVELQPEDGENHQEHDEFQCRDDD
ncbi:MAG: hypothetical protein BMS9Abin01_0040 [Gammaproteobacteria bacterium]|nr:MAG: hypothetical protein BMS9Abin01_0040 [Gammaproteobacteria bacterium]